MIERHGTGRLASLLHSHRVHTLGYKLLIKDIKHFEKRAVRRYALDLVGLEMALFLGVFLAPYFQSQIHSP